MAQRIKHSTNSDEDVVDDDNNNDFHLGPVWSSCKCSFREIK